jgi:hypothetical protein
MLAIYKFELYGLAGRHATVKAAADILPDGKVRVEQIKAAAEESQSMFHEFRIVDCRYSTAETGGDKPALLLSYMDGLASATDAPSISYGEEISYAVRYVPYSK